MIPIVDSNVLIDWLRGRQAARSLLRPAVARGEMVGASVVSRTELLHGLRPSERPAFDSLASALEWIPVTVEIADAAGALASRYGRSHTSIETVDYVIAATTELMGGVLWTRNVRHFPMFPELTAPY